MLSFSAVSRGSRIRGVFFSLLVLLLAACGGGGGGGGGSGGASSCPGGFITCSSGGNSSSAAGTITLSLVDPVSGTASNTLTFGKPLTVKALVKGANGAVAPNVVVTFTTDAAMGVFDPTSGTALSGANGVASLNLQAASLLSSGAASVNVTANIAGQSVTQSIGYAVSPGTITLSNLAANATSLSAYGSTSVSVQVSINGVLASSAQTVTFSSACDTAGKASISHSVSSVNGVATATYTDKGCAGMDTITATVQGSSSSISLQVAAPQASNVSFVSATPSSLALAGTGGAGVSSDAVVTFRVVDSTNTPLASRAVAFDLSTRVGGILLNGQASGTVVGTSDASGLVSVTVTAGSVPTPVWVIATLVSNPAIRSLSPNLTISTGRPSQKNFSVAVETLNIEGWDLDGVTTPITARVYDRLGNPVANGTAVNFISEGGGVQSSCTTSGGACSVQFTAAEFRPSNGRVSVLAYAQGEESFTDQNTNNKYDYGEPFDDLGDAFIDNNEDGTWQAGEREIAFGAAANASNTCVSSTSAPSKAGTCDGQWGAAHVRRNVVVTLSSYQIGTASASACSADKTTSVLTLDDINSNPLPAGSTIEASVGTTVLTVQPGTVPNVSSGKTSHAVSATTWACATGNVITIRVKTPKGFVSSKTVTVP